MASSCAHHPVLSSLFPTPFLPATLGLENLAHSCWPNGHLEVRCGVDGGGRAHVCVLLFALRPHWVPSLRTPCARTLPWDLPKSPHCGFFSQVVSYSPPGFLQWLHTALFSSGWGCSMNSTPWHLRKFLAWCLDLV